MGSFNQNQNQSMGTTTSDGDGPSEMFLKSPYDDLKTKVTLLAVGGGILIIFIVVTLIYVWCRLVKMDADIKVVGKDVTKTKADVTDIKADVARIFTRLDVLDTDDSPQLHGPPILGTPPLPPARFPLEFHTWPRNPPPYDGVVASNTHNVGTEPRPRRPRIPSFQRQPSSLQTRVGTEPRPRIPSFQRQQSSPHQHSRVGTEPRPRIPTFQRPPSSLQQSRV